MSIQVESKLPILVKWSESVTWLWPRNIYTKWELFVKLSRAPILGASKVCHEIYRYSFWPKASYASTFTKIGVPTPLEHLSNIINCQKWGENKILRDFKDNSKIYYSFASRRLTYWRSHWVFCTWVLSTVQWYYERDVFLECNSCDTYCSYTWQHTQSTAQGSWITLVG